MAAQGAGCGVEAVRDANLVIREHNARYSTPSNL